MPAICCGCRTCGRRRLGYLGWKSSNAIKMNDIVKVTANSTTKSSSTSSSRRADRSTDDDSTNNNNNNNIAAFFDFDKTILSTDCAGKEAEEFWDKSYAEQQYWLYAKLTFFAVVIFKLYSINLWVDGEGINRWYYYLCYSGMLYKDLQTNAQRLYDARLRHKLYPEILKLMQYHHDQGHLVYVVSASPIHLIRPFVNDPKYKNWITGLVSTEIDVDSTTGRCTGRTKYGHVCIGHEKSVVQKRLGEQMKIDLEKSYAYSDHHHDLEFLECVGHPVVVNPTPQLESVAQQRNWKALQVTMDDDDHDNDDQKKKTDTAAKKQS
jgi:HAD superfamily hydrolase (TIGR01490 family)